MEERKTHPGAWALFADDWQNNISPTYIKGIFGEDIIPNVCFSTAKLNLGIQYTEGQDVCINAHNQVAFYPNIYTEEEEVMPFLQHLNEIRWKILAIMWSTNPNLISKTAGEPVFLVFSEHITQWYNDDRDFGKEETCSGQWQELGSSH